jgi:pimeloyl-ACP methyl ester carboxylesterase
MQSGHLVYRQSTIHYRYGGEGARPLVCFHGYGESSGNFDFLEKSLGNDYTIIAPDLPFHRETIWNEGVVDIAMLADVVVKLLEHLKIAPADIHLLGFSLGGRLALCVLQELKDRVSKVVLLAPDGLTINFWYWLSTQTVAGRSLFRLTMSKPGWFLGMLSVANKVKLLNQSIYKFVKYYIHDDEVRKELYERWTGLRNCSPDTGKVKELVQQHRIIVHLLYGRHDRIIGHKKGERFLKELPGCRVEVLNCGHQVLHEKNIEAIVKALLY